MLEKLLDQEREIGDRFEMADELMVSKFNSLDADNSQKRTLIKQEITYWQE